MKIYVIIATSNKRNELLITRSLLSVYKQKISDKTTVKIIIVDDNLRKKGLNYSEEFESIKNNIDLLRHNLNIYDKNFETYLIPNTRTQYKSGTGSWNTGILKVKELEKENQNVFISILDDDDEYNDGYMLKCIEIIIKNKIIAIFPRIEWKFKEKEPVNNLLQKQQLTAENFFIGNPGVQGSNMFFELNTIININGFDENLESTTDRDLMIRFLLYVKQNNLFEQIYVIEEYLVMYYNHLNERITTNFEKKKKGLDLFYKKYKHLFSDEIFLLSLKRAKRIFNYEYTK